MSRDDVRSIKRRIVAKESLHALAAEFKVGYMAIYKIAIGKTWKGVKPRGRLIGKRDYTATRTLPVAKCEAIALIKIRKSFSNLKIAKRLSVSESTVRRAIEYGELALGLRLRQHMVRGTLKDAQAQLQLTEDEVEDLIRSVKRQDVPDWLRKAVEGDD